MDAFLTNGQSEKIAMERVSENMHVVANEPSLALYRLQEHVRKGLPFMVEKRAEFGQLHEQLQGRCYDADYAVRYRLFYYYYNYYGVHE